MNRGRFIGLLGPLAVLAAPLLERPPPVRIPELDDAPDNAPPVYRDVQFRFRTPGRNVFGGIPITRPCKACGRSQFKRCAEHRKQEARARALRSKEIAY